MSQHFQPRTDAAFCTHLSMIFVLNSSKTTFFFKNFLGTNKLLWSKSNADCGPLSHGGGDWVVAPVGPPARTRTGQGGGGTEAEEAWEHLSWKGGPWLEGGGRGLLW